MAEGVELEEDDPVEYRERCLPRSVSVYDELETEAAFEALLEAPKSLLPLADYVEETFSVSHSGDLAQDGEVQGNRMQIHGGNEQR